MNNRSEIQLVEPVLFDRFANSVSEHLLSNLTWLDRAFGRANTLTEQRDGREVRYPGIKTDKAKEYLAVEPDSHIGNYCFFYLPSGGVNLDHSGRDYFVVEGSCSLVFWFDIRKVYNDWNQRSEWNVANDVLTHLLVADGWFGKIRLSSIYDVPRRVFEEYSLSQIKNQYMMRPYGAIRIDMDFQIDPQMNC